MRGLRFKMVGIAAGVGLVLAATAIPGASAASSFKGPFVRAFSAEECPTGSAAWCEMSASADGAASTMHVDGTVEDLSGAAVGNALARAGVSNNYQTTGNVQSASGHFVLDLTEAVAEQQLRGWASVVAQFCITSGGSYECEAVVVAAPGPEFAPSGPCRVEVDLALANEGRGAMKWISLYTSLHGFANLAELNPTVGSGPGSGTFLAEGKATMTPSFETPTVVGEPTSTCSLVARDAS